jgi:hypothetical protein
VLDVHAGVPQQQVRLEQSAKPQNVLVMPQGSSSAVKLAIKDADALYVDTWQLATDDINFDGYADLYLVTRRGAANAYAEYWRFVPESGSFEDLGVFPVFTLDANSKRLSTYERNGSAGLEYERGEYAIEASKPVLQRHEAQVASEPLGTFEKTVSVRKGAEMKAVERKTVKVSVPEE